jgi:hypothetical protein
MNRSTLGQNPRPQAIPRRLRGPVQPSPLGPAAMALHPWPSIGVTPTPEPMVTAGDCAGEAEAAQTACQTTIGMAAGALLTWLFVRGNR